MIRPNRPVNFRAAMSAPGRLTAAATSRIRRVRERPSYSVRTPEEDEQSPVEDGDDHKDEDPCNSQIAQRR